MKTILLFEQNALISEHIKSIIVQLDYRCVQAYSLSEARALLRLYLPDYAIINFCYSQLTDGMAFAAELRVPYCADTLFITSLRPVELTNDPDWCPLHDVLYKPFTTVQLKQTLHRFFEL